MRCEQVGEWRACLVVDSINQVSSERAVNLCDAQLRRHNDGGVEGKMTMARLRKEYGKSAGRFIFWRRPIAIVYHVSFVLARTD
jgi:hypothetical protein